MLKKFDVIPVPNYVIQCAECHTDAKRIAGDNGQVYLVCEKCEVAEITTASALDEEMSRARHRRIDEAAGVARDVRRAQGLRKGIGRFEAVEVTNYAPRCIACGGEGIMSIGDGKMDIVCKKCAAVEVTTQATVNSVIAEMELREKKRCAQKAMAAAIN